MTSKAERKRQRELQRKAENPISAAKRRPHKDMRSVVIDQRVKHHGLTPDQASDERAGTALGRAFVTKAIDDTLYRAGDEYKNLHTAYMRAINAPDGFAVSDCGDGGSPVTNEYEDWAERAIENWLTVSGALWHRSAWNAVITESLVLNDADQQDTHIGYAKTGLRFLSKKLGIVT